MMVDTVGCRKATEALSLGLVYNFKDAISIGLVDKLYESSEAIVGGSNCAPIDIFAEKEITKWTKAPGRADTKLLLRSDAIRIMLDSKSRLEDIIQFKNLVTSARVQSMLGSYLESLKKKK
jgi:hypothetical protein